MSTMLFEESLFSASTAFTAAATAAHILQQAPKLENNNLLLETLDFNLTNSIPDSHFKSFDSDVISSVFSNSDDPLISQNESDSSIDEELKEIFGFVPEVTVKKEESSVPFDEDIFNSIELEARSQSTAADFISIPTLEMTNTFDSSPSEFGDSNSSCKRSYSTADLDSDLFSDSDKDKLGCTPYTRKQRIQPLPPVVPKGGDVASMKRARNTEAARRSRARKMERMSQLEDKCEGLIQENESLKQQLEALKAALQARS